MLCKGGNLHNFHLSWVDIWRLDVSHKLCHFIWRIYALIPLRLVHSYSTATSLMLLTVCVGCGQPETSYHALFGFNDTQNYQRTVVVNPWKLKMRIILCVMFLIDGNVQVDVKVRKGGFLMWCIRGERNDKVYNDKAIRNHVLLRRIKRYVEEQGKYTKAIYPRQQ